MGTEMIGETIGNYRITAKIGAGGMGEVYRATDGRLGRDVAIKFSTEQFGERFEREARAVAALNHANICTLFDVGPNYLVMELVEGVTLAERISQGPMPLDEALGFARQIAAALESAHEAGIVHRDLKPGNVKIKPDGTIKVLDFGLAKMGGTPTAGSENSPTISMAATQAGVILGTAAYMSPEQARGKPVDKHADIWVFGVVFFEMLTGRRLFEGADTTETLAAVIKEQPDWNLVPEKVRRLLRRCLEKEPKNRLHDIRDMELLLEDAQRDQAGASVSRVPWVVVAGLAGVLAVVLWGWWSFSRPPEAPPQPLIRLDVDLGPDVSLGSLYGPDIIISPDGPRIVYVSANRLYTRRLDQTKAVELPETLGAWAPFFSPNGQWVGFFVAGRLKKIAVAGGTAVELCVAPGGRGASWGEDDTIIASFGATGLYRIPSGGGAPAAVTELAPGEITHRWPQILPGGKAVLFTSSTSGAFDGANVEVMSFADRQRKVLQRGATFGRYVAAPNGAGYLTYASRGTLYAVAFDPDTLMTHGAPAPVLDGVSYSVSQGTAQVDFSSTGTLISRSGAADSRVTVQWLEGGGKARPLLSKPGMYSYPDFSPDGRHLALLSTEGSGEPLVIYDWQRDRMTPLTFDTATYANPIWSPDGRYIAARSSSAGIFWIRSDGAGKPQPLIQSKNVQYPRSFSPDGNRLAFDDVSDATGYDLWTVSIVGDSTGLQAGKPELFLRTPFNERNGVFSPDGHWLAYFSDESGGSFQVYGRAFPDNGGKWQVSDGPDGGLYPVFSPNGKELFFQTIDNRLMVVNYTANGQSFVTEKPRLWSEQRLVNLGLRGAYAIARDGKSIAAVVPVASSETTAQNHVTFLMNFVDEISRRLAANTGTR
jgi:serine/threonine protein kinase